ncbi:MAG: NUDIX domain-containing protein [Burkholderiales bacterium]
MPPTEPGDEGPRYREYRHCPRCGAPFRAEDFHEAECLFLCAGCGLDFYQNPLPAAVLALTHPERPGALLFLKRSTPPGIGRWCVPGGFIRYGELPAAAAAREAREEVGVEAEIGPILRAGLVDYLYRGRRLCIVEIAFLARPAGPLPAATLVTPEASEIAWLEAAEVLAKPESLAFPEQAGILRAFLANPGLAVPPPARPG